MWTAFNLWNGYTWIQSVSKCITFDCNRVADLSEKKLTVTQQDSAQMLYKSTNPKWPNNKFNLTTVGKYAKLGAK